MNIRPITFNNTPVYNNYNNYNTNSIQHRTSPVLRRPLDRDTVSFKQSSIKESLELQHERNMAQYRIYADVFFDALENVAHELSGYGVSFDRQYAMLNPIKSAASMSSKISRSGSFDVPDLIRTTIYLQNPYDEEFIYQKFLPAMEDKGYVLSKVNGKPDIDFRLEGIGHPQKSGYEDIQMRFVEKKSKKNKIKHELIILFGPNYANAKHLESEKVYHLIRQFDELNIDLKDAPIGSHEFKANRYIELIKTQAQNKISKKLFDNAKNKDYYKIDDVSPISFTPDNKMLLNTYFAALKDRTKDAYKIKRHNAQNSKIALIQLKKDEKDDLTLINYINDMLNATIQYFEKNPQ